jgi:hypothetical protein
MWVITDGEARFVVACFIVGFIAIALAILGAAGFIAYEVVRTVVEIFLQ